jgi:hypothetical protein
MAIVLSKPSSLIHEIQIEKVGTWNVAELDSIGELDRIFTHINAMIASDRAN